MAHRDLPRRPRCPPTRRWSRVGVASDELSVGLDAAGVDAGYAAARGFTAKVGQTLTVAGPTDRPVRRARTRRRRSVPRSCVAPRPRSAGPVVASRSSPCACSTRRSSPRGRPAAAQAVAEGIVLGAYRFTTYKSEPDPVGSSRSWWSVGGGAPRRARARARRHDRRRASAWPATSSTRPAATSRRRGWPTVAAGLAASARTSRSRSSTRRRSSRPGSAACSA